MIRTLGFSAVFAAGVLCATAGCGQKQVGRAQDDHSPSPPPTIASGDEKPIAPPVSPAAEPKPAPGTRPFSGPGIQLGYGDGWHAADNAEYALVLVPADAAGKSSDVSVTVEVPKLPPHVPGLIPLGSVVKGYIDDMKKQQAGVQVETPMTTKVAGVNARRVVSTWKADGKELSEDAVLAVHSDHVYIFRANSDASNRDRAKAELDALLQSIQWR